RRRHTRSKRDWSSDVCSSDLVSSRRSSKFSCRYSSSDCMYFSLRPVLAVSDSSIRSFASTILILILGQAERPTPAKSNRVSIKPEFVLGSSLEIRPGKNSIVLLLYLLKGRD